MNTLRKIGKSILNLVLLFVMGYSEEGVDKGYLDFSGQGRDKYGR